MPLIAFLFNNLKNLLTDRVNRMLRHTGNMSGAAKPRSKCPEEKVKQF